MFQPGQCRECRRRPSRAADDFCSDTCQHAHTVRTDPSWQIVPPVCSPADNARAAWGDGHMKVNLQNSA